MSTMVAVSSSIVGRTQTPIDVVADCGIQRRDTLAVIGARITDTRV